MMSKHFRIFLLALGLLLTSGLVFAQSSSQSQPSATTTSQSPELLNKEAASDLRTASMQAGEGHPAPSAEEEEENAQFKYHALWRIFDEGAVAAKTGLSKEAVYWIYVVINFVILAAVLRWVALWLMGIMLPGGFASRNAEIQKGIAEARKASAEANARLSEIEGCLARLDAEIAEIRTAAEADFSHEEQRIKAAAEQDAKNVIAAAEQEIAAATRVAQRELKSFVAGLAVDLAEKKIKVDDATDQALVHAFAAKIGKDGQ
ncbi:MAG: ATP synthase F0 subunit B [Candidatus Korobacteraceae bacterium]